MVNVVDVLHDLVHHSITNTPIHAKQYLIL